MNKVRQRPSPSLSPLFMNNEGALLFRAGLGATTWTLVVDEAAVGARLGLPVGILMGPETLGTRISTF